MEKKITATELAKSLSDVLNRVYYRGESFVIERNGDVVATLGPAKPEKAATVGELIEHLKKIHWPLEGFADDLEAIQASQRKVEPPPWDS